MINRLVLSPPPAKNILLSTGEDMDTAFSSVRKDIQAQSVNIKSISEKVSGLFMYTSDNIVMKRNCIITCTDSDQQIFFMFGMNTPNTAGLAVFSSNTKGSGKALSNFGSPLISSISTSSSSINLTFYTEWSHFVLFSTDNFNINIQ